MFKKDFRFTHLEEDFDHEEIMGHNESELQPQSLIPNANDFVPHIPADSGQAEEKSSNESNTESQKKDIHSIDSHLNNYQTPLSQTNGTAHQNFHVQYAEGKVNMMKDNVVIRPDGTPYIDTQGIAIRWSEHERPLRKRRLLITKVFSVISCFMFFPTGIPAAYFAFRAEKEFQEGVSRDNINRAMKFAKRSEKFIIMSVVMCVVVATLIVAIINRPDISNMPRGTLVG
ncbi:hypothetical protein BgiMline_011677 [Biomphalaria glabrata]|nr:hypothetical protein BgiMline_029150 [Biomphalaria glabrata]